MITDADMVKVGFDAVLAPVRDTFNRLPGPMADELGGILADPVRVFRFKRTVRLLEKVKKIAEGAGFEPNAVPLKTLLPILENASLEEDEDLHDRWANLLANAAKGTGDGTFYSTFSDMLRFLTPAQARFLDLIHSASFSESIGEGLPEGAETAPSLAPLSRATLASFWCRANAEAGDTKEALRNRSFYVAVSNLEKLGILTRTKSRLQEFVEGITMDDACFYTGLACEFVKACRTPKRNQGQ